MRGRNEKEVCEGLDGPYNSERSEHAGLGRVGRPLWA
ncbi:hypothetical protein SAMN04488556_2561 [Halostagnicola kamekurae]|uniref:Uncharacterized protein n=1 Tax=Halostagnicola kamekurae TaxID=619731 RepID=A0A1I6SCV1_9EURY|nr:hypothetical protein SAMN04488556_2561 [Halostagnicola kamekurae]